MVQKTPCWMANNAVEQEKQRDYIIQKANILSFQGPIALFAFQQGVFVPRNCILPRVHCAYIFGKNDLKFFLFT